MADNLKNFQDSKKIGNTNEENQENLIIEDNETFVETIIEIIRLIEPRMFFLNNEEENQENSQQSY